MPEAEYWWVSFATEHANLGVVIVPRENAEDMVALARRLWMLGLNPGGEMMASCASADVYLDSSESWALNPANQLRLIPSDELDRKGYPKRGDLAPKGFNREAFEAHADQHTYDNELSDESKLFVIQVLRKRLHDAEAERDRARHLAAKLEEVVAMRTLVLEALVEVARSSPSRIGGQLVPVAEWAEAQLSEIP